MADICLQKPSMGKVLYLHPTPKDTLTMDFDPEEVKLARQGYDLVFIFSEHAQRSFLVLSDFYHAYTLENMPECVFDCILCRIDTDILRMTGQEDEYVHFLLDHSANPQDDPMLVNFSAHAQRSSNNVSNSAGKKQHFS